MKISLSKGISSALVGIVMAFSGSIAPAHADSFKLHISGQNGSLVLQSENQSATFETVGHRSNERRHYDNDRRFHRESRRHHDYDRRHYRDYRRHICEPREAVHKAERFGLRRAEIQRINKRFVIVSGRKHGERLLVGLDRRSRHCSIAFVERQGPKYHRYGYRF